MQCGQNLELLNVKLVVHNVTGALWKVNQHCCENLKPCVFYVCYEPYLIIAGLIDLSLVWYSASITEANGLIVQSSLLYFILKKNPANTTTFHIKNDKCCHKSLHVLTLEAIIRQKIVQYREGR